MEDTDLQALMARLELLIDRVEQLKSQNGLLLAQEKTWREERAHLIEKNEIARRKVESMISRLKALDTRRSATPGPVGFFSTGWASTRSG